MNSIFNDIRRMHDKYGFHEVFDKMSDDQREEFLKFRLEFLREEFHETERAIKLHDAEEIVDGLIDVIVIAAGTLDLFGVDGEAAWFEVLKANMTKEIGIKEGRPNPLGLPDLVKPEGWKGPSHAKNHGRLPRI